MNYENDITPPPLTLMHFVRATIMIAFLPFIILGVFILFLWHYIVESIRALGAPWPTR